MNITLHRRIYLLQLLLKIIHILTSIPCFLKTDFHIYRRLKNPKGSPLKKDGKCRPFFLMRKLAAVKLGVESLFLQQLFVISLLYNMTIPHDEDQIRLLNGGKAMGHNEGGSALHHGIEGLLDPDFRTGINRGGCLIQEQHGRQAEHHPSNAKQLLLTLGEITATLGNYCIITFG
jgi:hypothetical protein